MLTLENVRVSYDTVEVLHGISMQVDKGEIVAIIGSNGAGKSTTLNSISGLIKTSSDSLIAFEGEKINNIEAHKVVQKGISFCPEGRRIFPDLTVQENLEMGAYLRKKDKEGVARDLKRMYELFPRLGERKKQKGKTLSGGELQMLAIARALMSEPKMFMLDEPSTGLAPLIVKEIFSILKDIRDMGMTILIVEQNSKLTLSIADRGYVLKTGRFVLQDTGANLLKNEDVKHAYLGENTYCVKK